MQYAYSVIKASCVNHPKRSDLVPEADLFDTLANHGHGLEIVRLLALLDFVDLITRLQPGVFWKVAQLLQGVAEKGHGFIGTNYIRTGISINYYSRNASSIATSPRLGAAA